MTAISALDNSTAVVTQFRGAVMHDRFGLLLIELGQFRPRRVIDAQQLIQLGMQRQIIAPVGALDEQRHDEYRQRCHRVPVERGAIEY